MATRRLNFSFTSAMHVKTRHEFSVIKKFGKKYYGNCLCFQFCENKQSHPKLGITVSKKYGNSPQRNLFKRRIRDLFRKNSHHFPSFISLNVFPLKSNQPTSYTQYNADFRSFIDHIQKKGTSNEKKL